MEVFNMEEMGGKTTDLSLWIYLDLVEVLSCLEWDHVVGRDACNGLICGVLCSVECQRCLTWDHLETNTVFTISSQVNPDVSRTRTRTRTWPEARG